MVQDNQLLQFNIKLSTNNEFSSPYNMNMKKIYYHPKPQHVNSPKSLQ